MSEEWSAEAADWYASHYGEYATNRLAVDALDVPSDADVVDIGCGAGAALRHVSQLTGGALTGVDPVPRMLEIARERAAGHPAADRLRFLRGHAHALPLDDDSADLVLAFDSFDHWGEDHQEAGLAEVRRIVRPGGRLVVVKDRGVSDPELEARFETLAEAAGLEVERDEAYEDDVPFRLWVLRVRTPSATAG